MQLPDLDLIWKTSQYHLGLSLPNNIFQKLSSGTPSATDLSTFLNLATCTAYLASPRLKNFPGQEIGKPAVSEVPDWPYNNLTLGTAEMSWVTWEEASQGD